MVYRGYGFLYSVISYSRSCACLIEIAAAGAKSFVRRASMLHGNLCQLPSADRASIEVENLAQRSTDRTVVRVGRHDVTHVLPPFLADFGRRDGCPLLLALDLGIAEELSRLGVDEDRVVRHAVVFEDLLQLRSDRTVPLLVFLFGAGMNRHDEGFAAFHDFFSLVLNRWWPGKSFFAG